MAKEIDLMKLVLEVDEQLIQMGAEPFQRPQHAYQIIAKRLKIMLKADMKPSNSHV